MQRVWKIIIAMVITAVVVGGGVYLWQKQTQISSEEERLKTVTDTSVGYTVKYPAAWFKVERDNGFDVNPGVGGFGFTLRYYDASTNLKEELISKIGYQAGTERSESRENIKVNGLEAVKVTVTTVPSTSEEPMRAIVFEGSGKIFILDDGETADTEFEDFYKSFKLTN